MKAPKNPRRYIASPSVTFVQTINILRRAELGPNHPGELPSTAVSPSLLSLLAMLVIACGRTHPIVFPPLDPSQGEGSTARTHAPDAVERDATRDAPAPGEATPTPAEAALKPADPVAPSPWSDTRVPTLPMRLSLPWYP